MKLKINGPGSRETVFEDYNPVQTFSFPVTEVGWYLVEIWSDDGKHLYTFEPMQCVPSQTINIPSIEKCEDSEND